MTEPADAMATILHLRAGNQRLRDAIFDASEPDFILAAIDNVHDMDATLDDYAAAASRAIRAATQEQQP